MLFDSIDPHQWYVVRDVSKIIGWSEDRIYAWVHEGLLQAFIGPVQSSVRGRSYNSMRVQGAEIIRFVKANLTVLRQERKLRIRSA